MTVPSKLPKKSSNQLTAFKSRPLVGSSSISIPGLPNRAWAKRTLTFSPPVNSDTFLKWYSVPIPKPCKSEEASASASQPLRSANSPSNSDALIHLFLS